MNTAIDVQPLGERLNTNLLVTVQLHPDDVEDGPTLRAFAYEAMKEVAEEIGAKRTVGNGTVIGGRWQMMVSGQGLAGWIQEPLSAEEIRLAREEEE